MNGSRSDSRVPANRTAGLWLFLLCAACSESELPGASASDVIPEDTDVIDSAIDSTTAGDGGLDDAEIPHAEAPDAGARTEDPPATVEMGPGRVAKIKTVLDRDAVAAGSDVRVRCKATDALGNSTTDTSIKIAILPPDDHNAVHGDTIHVTRARNYEVVCEHPRAMVEAAKLSVSSGPPSELLLATSPQRLEQAPGETVMIASTVLDAYGNIVPAAEVTLEADAGSEMVGPSAYRFQASKHIVKGRVLKPATPDEVTAELQIFVDGGPPQITCDDPVDGAQVVMDGDYVTLRGRVADGSGIAQVAIDDEPVAVNDGAFEYRVSATFGMNPVQIMAVDGAGVHAYQLCAFTAAPSWASSSIDPALTVQLAAAQVDDGDRTNPTTSIADLAERALGRPALRDAVHEALSERPELKPNECDQSILGECVLRSQVTYVDLELPRSPSLSLSLVDGGIEADLTMRDVRLRARVRGQAAGIEFDSLGWVTMQTIQTRAAFDVTLSSGGPHATLRGDSVSTTVGGVDTDFSDVDGAIIDLVAELFNGPLRSELAGAIQGVANDQLSDAVSDVLKGLDVARLGDTLQVKKLGDSIALELGFSLQSLALTPERMTLGVASSVDGDLARPAPTLGVPVRELFADARAGNEPFAVTVHEAFASQLVLGMWRGGMFDVNFDGREIGDLPKSLKGHANVEMPPVVELVGDRVRLSAGSIALDIQYAPLFGDEPVQARAAVRLSAALRLEAGRIALGDIRIDELRLASSRPDLMNFQTASTQDMLIPLLQKLLAPALEQVAPSIPIPSLAVPGALLGDDEPAATRLKLVSPALTFEPPRAVISGELGLE